jgi:ketosteroid isomerase-like protein
VSERSSSIAANKALVREFFDSWAESDFDRMLDLVDPDGEWWTLAKRKTRTCRDQIARVKTLSEETMTGRIEFLLGSLTAEDDRVAAVVESHAYFAEQGAYDNRYHFLFQVTRGRFGRIWVYYDTALANRVLRGEGSAAPPVPSHAND